MEVDVGMSSAAETEIYTHSFPSLWEVEWVGEKVLAPTLFCDQEKRDESGRMKYAKEKIL